MPPARGGVETGARRLAGTSPSGRPPGPVLSLVVRGVLVDIADTPTRLAPAHLMSPGLGEGEGRGRHMQGPKADQRRAPPPKDARGRVGDPTPTRRRHTRGNSSRLMQTTIPHEQRPPRVHAQRAPKSEAAQQRLTGREESGNYPELTARNVYNGRRSTSPSAPAVSLLKPWAGKAAQSHSSVTLESDPLSVGRTLLAPPSLLCRAG